MIKHIVIPFEVAATIPAYNSQVVHVLIPVSKLGSHALNLQSAKAAIRVTPDVALLMATPQMSLYLSKGVMNDLTENNYNVVINEALEVTGIFFHHVFGELPQNSEKEYFKELPIEFAESVVASLLIENRDPVADINVGYIFFVTLTFEYEKRG